MHIYMSARVLEGMCLLECNRVVLKGAVEVC